MLSRMSGKHVVVVGGGAAGYFGAIACAEANPSLTVTLLEATRHPLAKVRISGGGRCNVTNSCTDPREFATHYPRGARELLGPLHRFGARDTVAWFAARGVELKAEPDGRMFPETDSSATIIDCLERSAREAGVHVRTCCAVRTVVPTGGGDFALALHGGETVAAERVLLATGGGASSGGIALARALGHAIEPLVPSLFTFRVVDARLTGLEGLAVGEAEVFVPATSLRARGPILVTHWGLSGPAVLRLSAWGARELHARNYAFPVRINWAGGQSAADVEAICDTMRREHGKRRVISGTPLSLPLRLWERLVTAAGIPAETIWAALPREPARRLVDQLTAGEFRVEGKSTNKEEFVTCGGVRLREVDFRTMASRVRPGLHLAGEILDIDGITGGFNFQSAWTTSWIAGRAMAEEIG
jgi:predicted Rossmann fold flavoprotein